MLTSKSYIFKIIKAWRIAFIDIKSCTSISQFLYYKYCLPALHHYRVQVTGVFSVVFPDARPISVSVVISVDLTPLHQFFGSIVLAQMGRRSLPRLPSIWGIDKSYWQILKGLSSFLLPALTCPALPREEEPSPTSLHLRHGKEKNISRYPQDCCLFFYQP